MRSTLAIVTLLAAVGAAQAQQLTFQTPFTPGTPGTPGTPAIPGAVQLAYSGALSAASLRYNRVNGAGTELLPLTPTALSTTGTSVAFSVQSFIPTLTAAHEFFSAQSYDGFLSLYESTFVAATPLVNVRAADDDMVVLNGGIVPNRNGVATTNDSGFRFNLTAGTTYQIVTSSFDNSVTAGTFYNEVRSLGTPAIPGIPGIPGSPIINIPDNVNAGVSLDLVVPNSVVGNLVSFDSLDLTNINHTWIGDLIITLTHVESGTSAIVLNRAGSIAGDASFLSDLAGNYSFSDAATGAFSNANPVNAPGAYAPANPLSVFAGISAAGTWRLNISDRASLDTGSFSAFGVTFTIPTPGTAALLGLGSLVATRRRR